MPSRTSGVNAIKRRGGRYLKRKRFLSRSAIAGGAVSFGVLVVPQVAAAAVPVCLNGAYVYGGENTNNSTYIAGAEGDISVDSTDLPYGASTAHQINYLAASTQNTGCYHGGNGGQCQIQAGYGSGYVGESGDYAETSSNEAYMEEEDINGYDPSFYTFALTQNDYISDFFTGTTTKKGSITYGLYDAYITPAGSSPVLVGQAYLPNYAGATIFADAESVNITAPSPYDCPAVHQTDWFGTNGSGKSSAGTQIDLYNAISKTWGSWPAANFTNNTSIGSYTYSSVNPPGAFGTYKTGDN
jgi:hypothetical protein